MTFETHEVPNEGETPLPNAQQQLFDAVKKAVEELKAAAAPGTTITRDMVRLHMSGATTGPSQGTISKYMRLLEKEKNTSIPARPSGQSPEDPKLHPLVASGLDAMNLAVKNLITCFNRALNETIASESEWSRAALTALKQTHELRHGEDSAEIEDLSAEKDAIAATADCQAAEIEEQRRVIGDQSIALMALAQKLDGAYKEIEYGTMVVKSQDVKLAAAVNMESELRLRLDAEVVRAGKSDSDRDAVIRLREDDSIDHQHTMDSFRRQHAAEIEAVRDACARDVNAEAFGEKPAKPTSSLTPGARGRARKSNFNLPKAAAAIREAWKQSAGNVADFTSLLAGMGLQVERGSKAGIWVIKTQQRNVVGSVNRILKAPKDQIRVLFEANEKNVSSQNLKKHPKIVAAPNSVGKSRKSGQKQRPERFGFDLRSALRAAARTRPAYQPSNSAEEDLTDDLVPHKDIWGIPELPRPKLKF
jgi:hypothetical protein